jgi:hypothetical protein
MSAPEAAPASLREVLGSETFGGAWRLWANCLIEATNEA